jgi:hypothetical protein
MPDQPPPKRVFAPPHSRKATIDALIEVLPDPSVRPGRLEPLLSEVADRVGELLDAVGSMDVPAEVTVEFIGVSPPRQVPTFPVAFGGRLLFDHTEVEEAVEGLRAGTPYEGLLHDAAGRAFSCAINVGFRREEEWPVSQVFTFE